MAEVSCDDGIWWVVLAFCIPGVAFAVASQTGTDAVLPTFATARAVSC